MKEWDLWISEREEKYALTGIEDPITKLEIRDLFAI